MSTNFLTGRYRYLRIPVIVAAVLLIVMICTLILFSGSSISWMFDTEDRMTYNNPFPIYDREAEASLYAAEMESVFIHSRLVLAESDSTCLVISIPDSLIWIELTGVKLHEVKADVKYLSPILHKMNKRALLQWLSKPLADIKEISTIEKKPVVVKNAPRDSTEVSNDHNIDQTVDNFAAFLLHFDNGLIVQVRQRENPGFRQSLQALKFNLDLFRQYRLPALFRALTFRQPVYYPAIVIRAEQQEVVNLYRAIPNEVRAVLKLH